MHFRHHGCSVRQDVEPVQGGKEGISRYNNKQPLMNIATSTVATETVTQFGPCEKNRRS